MVAWEMLPKFPRSRKICFSSNLAGTKKKMHSKYLITPKKYMTSLVTGWFLFTSCQDDQSRRTHSQEFVSLSLFRTHIVVKSASHRIMLEKFINLYHF